MANVYWASSLLSVRHSSMHFIYVHLLTPHNNPRKKVQYHLHLPGEETEALKGEVTCLRSHSSKWQRWD